MHERSQEVSSQTFGDSLGFNPHCYIIVTDGCFYGTKGMFRVAPPFEMKKLEALFRHKVFKMLLAKDKITEDLIRMLSGWRHSGFNVFCGKRISPGDETAMENLARYIIRASFSQERMNYLDQEGKVVYTSKDGETTKIFTALEWMASMCSHIPNKAEQMVRYYGYYSNVSRGRRKEAGMDDAVPCIIKSQGDEKMLRKNWARLIKKIYEVDPLVCPKCKGTMRIICFIEDGSVIRAILEHMGLWFIRSRPPPAYATHTNKPTIQTPPTLSESKPSEHRLQPYQDDYCYADPVYSWDDYFPS